MAEGRTSADGRPAESRESALERLDAVNAEYRKRADEMKLIEERLARLELRCERMTPRTELGELKSRVDGIDEQIRALAERLGG